MPVKRDTEKLVGAIVFLITTATNDHNLRGLPMCIYSFTFLEVRVQSER